VPKKAPKSGPQNEPLLATGEKERGPKRGPSFVPDFAPFFKSRDRRSSCNSQPPKHGKATASWRWMLVLKEAAPRGKRVVRLILGETSARLRPVPGPGAVVLGAQKRLRTAEPPRLSS